MAERRVLGAVTEKRHWLPLAQFLQQAKGELLSVIADRLVLRIEFGARQDLIEISLAERLPFDLAILERAQQLLARAETRHPDIEAILWNPAPTKARRQNPQTVGLFNLGVD